MTVSTTRKMAELLRIHNATPDIVVDVEALRELLDNSEWKALVVAKFGSFWPVLTEEGARVVAELVAAFEEQT